jgi:hypothetical protein
MDLEIFDKEELVIIMNEYDEYIQEANDNNKYDDGWLPVCISEFIQNDLLYVLENIEDYEFSTLEKHYCSNMLRKIGG